MFEALTTEQARLLVLGIGLVVIAVIYLWGSRAQIRARLEERRRREAARRAELSVAPEALDALGSAVDAERQEPGEFGAMRAQDPFADQRLVDVEIRPLPLPLRDETPAASSEPLADAALRLAPTLAPPAPAEAEPPEPVRREPPIPPLNLRPAANAAEVGRGARKSAPEPMHVVLTILAEPGKRFLGLEILRVAHELGLRYSKQGVLDGYPGGEAKGKPTFSVANLVEPGVFPPEGIEALKTPGLLLFMRLPGAQEPLAALDFMLAQARRLAAKLDGTLCDDKRVRIGPDGLAKLRQQVGEFEHRLRVPESV